MNTLVKMYHRWIKRKNEVRYWKDIAGVTIGEGTKLYNVRFDPGHAWLISIGKNCTLTNCLILTHDASTYSIVGKTKVAVVNIGDNVFIGMEAIVMPGVSIGDNCIAGAGAVVTKSILNNSIVAGNPAKIIGTYDEYVLKCKEAYESHNVGETYYTQKSLTEKIDMKDKLNGTDFGFDA